MPTGLYHEALVQRFLRFDECCESINNRTAYPLDSSTASELDCFNRWTIWSLRHRWYCGIPFKFDRSEWIAFCREPPCINNELR